MGGLANFAGALGGAIVQTTNRFIDEEMQMNKARALAELQRATAKGIREDEAEFEDRRAPIKRQRAADDAEATAATADRIELSRLKNTTLMGARREAKDAEASDEVRRSKTALMELTPAKAAAEGAITTARESAQTAAMRERLPLEVQRAAATADAAARASAKYRERPPGPAERMAEIAKVLGRDLTEPEKLALIGLSKADKGATEEITTEFDEKGEQTGSKRVVKGPVGVGGKEAADPIRAALERNRAEREAKNKGGSQTAAQPTARPATKSLEEVVGMDEAQTLRGLAKALMQMKSGLANAARSGGDIPGNTEAVTRASQALSQRLNKMSDQQRALVEQLLGI